MTLTYNEFFLRLDELSAAKNVKLSFYDKDFFFNLVSYCERFGFYDYEKSMFCVEGSVRFFKDEFSVSSIRLVQEAILKLIDLRIIQTQSSPPKKTLFLINFPYIELKERKE